MKIYHPDVFKGDEDFAKERLSQLNAAYEFLSDEQQKREFDRKSQKQDAEDQQSEFDPNQGSDEFDEGIKILKENWDYACDYYPELKQLYNNLSVLGKEPAFAFMAYVVETKKYKEAATIADQLEDAFLTTKFSNDPKIKKLAKLALQQKEIKFAKELNRALTILGPESKDQILIKLSEHFPEFSYVAYRNCGCFGLLSQDRSVGVREKPKENKRPQPNLNSQVAWYAQINELLNSVFPKMFEFFFRLVFLVLLLIVIIIVTIIFLI